jgi:rubrerythrin
MKPVIDAKQARDDIRSGMSLVALLAKYNLSLKGFQSLVNKLIEAGAITKAELQRLMPEFMKVAQIWAEDSDLLGRASLAAGRDINAFEAVRAVRSGLSNADLMKKYRLSPKGLENLFEHLVGEGLLLPSELEFRLSALAGAIDAAPPQSESKKKPTSSKDRKAVWTCPACGRSQPREYEECPVCGVIVARYKPRPSDQNNKP